MDDSELKTESVTSEEFRSRLPITRDSEPTRTKSIQRFTRRWNKQLAKIVICMKLCSRLVPSVLKIHMKAECGIRFMCVAQVVLVT